MSASSSLVLLADDTAIDRQHWRQLRRGQHKSTRAPSAREHAHKHPTARATGAARLTRAPSSCSHRPAPRSTGERTRPTTQPTEMERRVGPPTSRARAYYRHRRAACAMARRKHAHSTSAAHSRPLMAADNPSQRVPHLALTRAMIFQRSTFFVYNNTERRWSGVKVRLKSFYTSRRRLSTSQGLPRTSLR